MALHLKGSMKKMALHDSDSYQILFLFHRGEFHGLLGVTLGTFLHLSLHFILQN